MMREKQHNAGIPGLTGRLDDRFVPRVASRSQRVERSSRYLDIGRSALSSLHTVSVEVQSLYPLISIIELS